MRKTSREYIEYLKKTKGISKNTEISYLGDLDKMIEYFNMYRVFDYERINETNLNSYILSLELKGNSGATVTRNIAVMKGYFDYLFKTHRISECITDNVKRPVFEANPVIATTKEQAERVLEQVQGNDAKSLRDHAMLQLFCTVGIQVTELITLQLDDINLEVGYIQSNTRNKKKTYSLPSEVSEIIETYLVNGRTQLTKDEENTTLFTNMQGQEMSRQGVWKMVKCYAKNAGLEEISPAKLCKASCK
ncbi:MAG: tyrosine-type recombinase/integrase [Eubacteriales bacterium]